MKSKLLMIGVWSGMAYVLLFSISLVFLTHWVPPPAPTLTAEETAQLFREHSVAIRVTGIFIAMAAAMYLPWTVMISELIRKTETDNTFLSGTQKAAGTMATITFFLPAYFWSVAAFRPERDPQAVYLIVDAAWMIFILSISPFIIQYLALAVSILIDKSKEPTFPRWLGYFQIWACVSFLPSVLGYFMKTGPFAWDGFFTWWLPLIVFSAWLFITGWYCRCAILKDTTS